MMMMLLLMVTTMVVMATKKKKDSEEDAAAAAALAPREFSRSYASLRLLDATSTQASTKDVLRASQGRRFELLSRDSPRTSYKISLDCRLAINAQFEYRPTCGLVSSSRPARPAELLGFPCYLLSTTRPFIPLLPLSEPRLSPGLRFLRASPSGSERLWRLWRMLPHETWTAP